MDREILFRGKFGNEWKYGYLSVEPKGLVIKELYEKNQSNIWHIDPETVGQYTGLTDKNGKKIFWGDIIKIRNKTRYVFFGVCRYRHTNYGEYAVDLSVKDGSNCEVIGNIHDNPELMEVSE